MYYELLEAGSGTYSPEEPDWVRVNFIGRSLSGDVFVTRSEDIAMEQGTKTPYTYYEPYYAYFNAYYSGLTTGQIEALKVMHQGDSVRLYLPSRLAYGANGTSFSNGYQGQNALPANAPAIFEMKLVEIVPLPVEREKELVRDYAFKSMGLAVSEGVRIDSLYVQITNKIRRPNANVITQDSTVYLYYVGKFLDDFIFDTNIDTIAQRVFKDYTQKSPLSYKSNDSSTSLITAFQYLFEAPIPYLNDTIRYGDSVKMVFISALGYGESGNSPESGANGTVIQAYTPLVFELVCRRTDDEE